jgi:hypothetical protein
VLQRELAGRLHAVDLAILRHGPALLGDAKGQRVAIEHRHALVEVRQDPRGQQPGHARSDDQRVLADVPGGHRRAGRVDGWPFHELAITLLAARREPFTAAPGCVFSRA